MIDDHSPGYLTLWSIIGRFFPGVEPVCGRAREECDSVYGTGFAGVRGLARSHKAPAKSMS
ncbi:MAG: hypothetical protein ACWA7D_15730 [Pseudomonas asiatica]